jgi:tripartite-type tricarboxylate transporter receptor subunit TctC
MKAIRKLATAIVLATATAAIAAYPERPIKIVVPFAAGGPSDAIARTLGRALSASVGQPVVVENKPGAEGLIAAQSVFSAPADGYTLFLSGTSSSVALSALRKDPGFDPLQFTPVTTVAAVTFCLYVNPDVPARTVAELVAHVKANPGKLNYAVAANSEFMAASQLMKATGMRMEKVPYKGSAQAIPELLAGRVQVYFAPMTPERLGYAKDGRLRMLATVSPARTPFTPQVPTMAEAGYPEIVLTRWNSLLGPPKLPADVVGRIAREVEKVLANPEVRAQFDNLTLEAGSSTPETLAAMERSASTMWKDFVRENDIPRE